MNAIGNMPVSGAERTAGAAITLHERQNLITELNRLWGKRERTVMAPSEMEKVNERIECITEVLRANPRNARRRGAD